MSVSASSGGPPTIMLQRDGDGFVIPQHRSREPIGDGGHRLERPLVRLTDPSPRRLSPKRFVAGDLSGPATAVDEAVLASFVFAPSGAAPRAPAEEKKSGGQFLLPPPPSRPPLTPQLADRPQSLPSQATPLESVLAGLSLTPPPKAAETPSRSPEDVYKDFDTALTKCGSSRRELILLHAKQLLAKLPPERVVATLKGMGIVTSADEGVLVQALGEYANKPEEAKVAKPDEAKRASAAKESLADQIFKKFTLPASCKDCAQIFEGLFTDLKAYLVEEEKNPSGFNKDSVLGKFTKRLKEEGFEGEVQDEFLQQLQIAFAASNVA